jgi:hypothetical protein
MPFTLHPFAAIKDGKFVRWQDNQTAGPGETVLPVIADPDPVLAVDEELRGPDFEILPDKVRAYGRVVKTVLSEIDQQGSMIRALAMTLFDVYNELRVLKGQQPLTVNAFKTYVKNKMG